MRISPSLEQENPGLRLFPLLPLLSEIHPLLLPGLDRRVQSRDHFSALCSQMTTASLIEGKADFPQHGITLRGLGGWQPCPDLDFQRSSAAICTLASALETAQLFGD